MFDLILLLLWNIFRVCFIAYIVYISLSYSLLYLSLLNIAIKCADLISYYLVKIFNIVRCLKDDT